MRFSTWKQFKNNDLKWDCSYDTIIVDKNKVVRKMKGVMSRYRTAPRGGREKKILSFKRIRGNIPDGRMNAFGVVKPLNIRENFPFNIVDIEKSFVR